MLTMVVNWCWSDTVRDKVHGETYASGEFDGPGGRHWSGCGRERPRLLGDVVCIRGRVSEVLWRVMDGWDLCTFVLSVGSLNRSCGPSLTEALRIYSRQAWKICVLEECLVLHSYPSSRS
jgi:hypothetical protein